MAHITVLLVEDNPGDARLVQEMMKEAGGDSFRLVRAGLLAEAQALLAEGSFQLVLLDLDLPDCRGLDTLSAALGCAQGTPVVVLTGRDDEALGAEAVRKGAQDYVAKGNLDCRLLLKTIRYAIERKRLGDQLRRSQKLETVGQLAGGVAHEFNNILMGIGGYAQLLLAQGDGTSEGAADLDRIRELSERGGSLSKQLLTFSRSEGVELLALDINPIVKNACKMLRKVLQENIAMDVSPASELGSVRCDPGQIEQVLVNLAINARDAMPDGGRLTIETTNTDQAPVGFTKDAARSRWVKISVTDTGCGMDEVTLQRIFDPFFTTKEVGKGTGLGLSTVYGIIQQHGGHIAAHSTPGKGTTFEVYLPRTDAEDQGPEGESEEEAPPRGSETILVVEDDESVRNILTAAVKSQGYKVIAASSPDEAEEFLASREDEVHLLLTDISMPVRNGDELYHRLVALHPDLKVIFVSGYFPESAPWRSDLPPDTIVLHKPFALSELARTLRQVLDRPCAARMSA